MSMQDSCLPRWDSEREYFDSLAANRSVVPLDAGTVHRYRNPDGPWAIDFLYKLAGDVIGKRVLDVGAGTGENSLVLAALGARVTALDVSGLSLEVLRKRAKVSGLEDRIETVCEPIELYSPAETFDIVWADAVLHHVIPSLDAVLRSLRAKMSRRGRILMLEPTSTHWLRELRLKLPIRVDGAPGERPLEQAELSLVREIFPNVRLRYFNGLSRVVRFIPERRARPLAYADAVLFRTGILRYFGSVVVMWADARLNGV